MNISELIEKKIEEGKAIVHELGSMRETNGMAINVVYYVHEDVSKFRKSINTWQLTSKEVLISAFDETHRYVQAFEKTFTKKNVGFDYKSEFEAEVNEGLSVLEGIHETLAMGLDKVKPQGDAIAKPPMVFISHSSKDKDFAEALVVLLEDLGFDKSTLFCSSIDGYGIGLSEDIFETLRGLFQDHDLFVMFIHSPRYYKSPMSLNEMGAAWVLKTDFCSFLTTDMKYDMMKGVVNDNTISIKVDAEDTPSRLTELKDKLSAIFILNPIDSNKWERKRQAFLDKVLAINYEPVTAVDETPSVEFNQEELQIFSKWANNRTDTTYMVAKTRAGLNVFFGSHNGYTFPYGEPMAEFEDFMQRLLSAGFIKIDRYDSKNRQIIYAITKQGYDYAKTLG